MADRLTPEQRSFNMSRIRGKDTKPEMVIRRMLHAMGYRFRLHRGDLPGRPDIVLPRWRAVVFVHGCFFHGHQCDLFRWPVTRMEFWQSKITANAERDRKAVEQLRSTGWRVAVVWECALKGRVRLPADAVATALKNFLLSGEGFAELRGAGR